MLNNNNTNIELCENTETQQRNNAVTGTHNPNPSGGFSRLQLALPPEKRQALRKEIIKASRKIPDLPHIQFQILKELALLTDERGYLFCSYTSLMKRCHIKSKRTVVSHIKKLISLGHLQKRATFKKGTKKSSSNDYYLCSIIKKLYGSALQNPWQGDLPLSVRKYPVDVEPITKKLNLMKIYFQVSAFSICRISYSKITPSEIPISHRQNLPHQGAEIAPLKGVQFAPLEERDMDILKEKKQLLAIYGEEAQKPILPPPPVPDHHPVLDPQPEVVFSDFKIEEEEPAMKYSYETPDVWKKCLEVLKNEIPENKTCREGHKFNCDCHECTVYFSAYITPLQAIMRDSTLVIFVPNRFVLSALHPYYADRIAEIAGVPTILEIGSISECDEAAKLRKEAEQKHTLEKQKSLLLRRSGTVARLEGDRPVEQKYLDYLRQSLRKLLPAATLETLAEIENEIVFATRFGQLRESNTSHEAFSVQYGFSVALGLVREGRWETPTGFAKIADALHAQYQKSLETIRRVG